ISAVKGSAVGGGVRIALFDTNFDIAVVVAAILSFIIGGIWYSRPVFGKVWMAVLGKTEADMEAMRKQAPKGVAGGLIGSFIASLILAIFLEYGRLANVGLPGGPGAGWASVSSLGSACSWPR